MSNRTKQITAELEMLRNSDGMINAVAAVKWARRHRQSALYEFLEWDDKIAGERYRVDQVRNFIQVHIVDAVGIRKYISLSIDRQTGGGYRQTGEILSRQDLRAIMIDDCFDDLDRVRRLYQVLNEFRPVWELIDRIRPRRAA